MSTIKKFALTEIEVIRCGAQGRTSVSWDLTIGVTYADATTAYVHVDCPWSLSNLKDNSLIKANPSDQCVTRFSLDLEDNSKTLRVSVFGTERSLGQSKPITPAVGEYFKDALQKDPALQLKSPNQSSTSVPFAYTLHFKIDPA